MVIAAFIAKDGHGWLNMIDAIEQSCDVYLYELAKRWLNV